MGMYCIRTYVCVYNLKLHFSLSTEGDSNVTYLFFRAKFEWTLKDYTLFNAARIIVQIIGSIFGLILLRKVSFHCANNGLLFSKQYQIEIQ